MGEQEELRDEVEHLHHALDTRDLIGMAKGILMHAENVGPDEAFAILRRASQRENRKLHDIAADMIAAYAECERPPA